jgi:acyl-CoA-binding protein
MPPTIMTYPEAISWVNAYVDEIPKDDLLRLYAYYKSIEVSHSQRDKEEHNLVTAFKANALVQMGNLTKEEAKNAYVELVMKLKQKLGL